MKWAIALALAGLASAAHPAEPARYMTADLVAETQAPRPGSTVLLGFRMTPRPGWHGYWSNPGDSGIAPVVRWTLPPGATAGPLLHPPPELLVSDGISSFVHSGPYLLLTRLALPQTAKAGDRLPVTAVLNWAACTATRCVPMRQTFAIDLVAGDGTPGPQAGDLKRGLSRVPRGDFHGTFAVSGKRVRLALPAGLTLNPGKARFFPDQNGFFDAASARSTRRDGEFVIEADLLASAGAPALSGVVSDGARAYRMAFAQAAAPVAVEAEPESVAKTAAPSAAARSAAAQPQAREAGLPETKPAAAGAVDRGSRWFWVWIAAATVVLAAVAWLTRRFYAARP